MERRRWLVIINKTQEGNTRIQEPNNTYLYVSEVVRWFGQSMERSLMSINIYMITQQSQLQNSYDTKVCACVLISMSAHVCVYVGESRKKRAAIIPEPFLFVLALDKGAGFLSTKQQKSPSDVCERIIPSAASAILLLLDGMTLDDEVRGAPIE